jgi:iron complex transport system ATP-binding protein
LAERDPGTLSGGERQRMEIAVLLAQSPRLALVDEPTNHLDPGQQVQMLHLLKTRFTTDGRALVMVLHDINLALAFCDRLLLIRGDGDWRAGPASETGTPETLSWLYDHPVRQAENCLSFL